MAFRFLYALRQAWSYRRQLKNFVQDPKLQIANICSLSQEYLFSMGIVALVLDYDGVLAAHGEPTPREEVLVWLRQCLAGPCQIFILSNKPTVERKEFFQVHFPTINFITAKRKKPYPDGILQILALSDVQESQLLLVDDRLCTGILATLITGTRGLWVNKPYVRFGAHALAEFWIAILRWLEHVAIALL